MNPARLTGFRSTTARFAALALLVLSLSSLLVLVVTERLATAALNADLLELTRAETSAVTAAFRQDGPDAAAAVVRAELSQSPHQIMLLEGRGGRRLAGNAQAWPPTLRTPTAWRELQLYAEGAAAPDLFAVSAVRLDRHHRLLLGHSLFGRTRLLGSLREAMFGTVALALLLAVGGAWTLSRFISSRVRAAAEAATAVTAGDLSRRVPESGDHDAFDELAAALNAMLSRIEVLVAELRLVTDSLAHDLRSPLTRIRMRIERAAADPNPQAARDALDAVVAETDALLHMLGRALEVSRAEAGIGREHYAAADLAELLRDVAEMYEPFAEEAGMTLEVDAPAELPVVAHREFLSQALANLVDNALRHSGGTAVRAAAHADADAVHIVVTDNGHGIPAAQRGRALARFSRLDAARSTPGSGLGLSLASAVARMHGGAIRLEDARPGLRVVLTLPLRPRG